VVNFVRDFTAKFGTVPNAFSALGYDSMYLVKDAIAKAGPADSTAIKNALAATNGAYLTGNLSFDAKHNPLKSAVVQEIVKGADGKLTTVYKTTVNP